MLTQYSTVIVTSVLDHEFEIPIEVKFKQDRHTYVAVSLTG